MKRRLVVAVPLLLIVALFAWIFRPKHETAGEAYVSERNVTLWSSPAQVRQALATLHFGEKVEVLTRRNENVRVRTTNGGTGWLDARVLMEPGLWQRSANLLKLTRTMPAQARGRTKVSTNLRVEPGRTQPRLFQFPRGASVEVVGRAVADWVQVTDERESPGEPQEAKKEDWFLIRGAANRASSDMSSHSADPTASEFSDQPVPVAGWVVARFVELDLPDAIREGASSANIRPRAWFELNRVADGAGEKPQYLLAGVRGAEGQPCDFATLRVFTWNPKRSRYETAFIENDLCGKLPITLGKGPKGEPEFRLRSKGEQRVYRLNQTVVRRVRESQSQKPGRQHSEPSRRASK